MAGALFYSERQSKAQAESALDAVSSMYQILV